MLPTPLSRLARLAAVTVPAALALAAPAAAKDTAYNILAPGEWGGVPLNANSDDQAKLYDALTPLRGDIGTSTIHRHFKPENFRPTGATRVEPTPRAGLRLVRDRFDVPHIYGRTDRDAYYGVGWVTAEDRGLLLSQGRNPARAAVADVPGLNAFGLVTGGPQYVPSAQAEALVTRQQRLLVKEYGAKGRRVLGDLDAFAAGVNGYLKQSGSTEKPWTRNDALATTAFIGSIFGNGGGNEGANDALLAGLRQHLGAKRGDGAFLDLTEQRDPEAPVSIRRRFHYADPSGSPAPGSPLIDPGSLQLTADPATQPLASNWLLVAPQRSASGNPLAVMGPQLGYYYPEIVLEADIHAPGINAQGAVAAGTGPYILIGRSRDYAWSLTTAQNNNVDTFVEKLCGGDSSHYVYKGECRAMTTFDAGTLGGKPLTFQMTVHGPVVGHATIGGQPYALARKRSTYGRDALSIMALRDMTVGKGRTVRGFFRSANEFGFTFNWAYVSRTHAAMFSSGRIPRQAPRTNSFLPTLGTGAYEWRGFLSEDEHPHDVDPRGGLLLNWNNKPARGWVSGDNVYDYGSIHRQQLFRGFPRKVRLKDVVSVMNRAATQDLRVMRAWPVIKAVLSRTAAPDARTAQMVALVDEWRRAGGDRLDRDLDGKVDAPGAEILDVAYPRIAEAVVSPVLGVPLTLQLAGLHAIDNSPLGRNGSSFGGGWYGYVDKDLRTLLGRSVKGKFRLRYCGNGSLPACSASLWAALKAAGDEIAATQGPDPAGWHADATKERISFKPGLLPTTMRWTNRPTFQQVIELEARRAAKKPHPRPRFTG